MMKNILVTGCSGFIGSTLCETLVLNENYTVIGIDNFDPFYAKSIKQNNMQELLNKKNFVFYEIDLLDSNNLTKIIEQYKPEIVVHLAAKAGLRPSMENPLPYYQSNVDGTISLLEVMRKNNITKMVFASSSSVYGENPKVPFSEQDSLNNVISFYAASKLACEQINLLYHKTYNISFVNLRFFTVFGPRQRPDLAIHKFFKSIINNEALTIYGDGSMERDYTYIEDIVMGVNAAIEYIKSDVSIFETINLGNNKPVSILNLVESIGQIVNKKPDVKFLDKPKGDVTITYADIKKAQTLLSYYPTTPLETGLNNFYEWLCNQK